MVEVVVSKDIQCAADEVLAFVMDPERYTQIDDKIGPIDWVRREGEVTEFRFRPKLPGIPGPAPKVVSRMRLIPGQRVSAEYAPLPQNKLAHRLSKFGASFVCVPSREGVQFTRTISIEVTPLVRWLVEPVLRRTLQKDVEREVQGVKDYLEGRRNPH
jgi:hypothetical protein